MSDLKLLIFVTAARLLNFSQTAKRFGVSQPAVTKRIQELEEDVKVRLFERVGSKLLLTREGEVFLKHAEQILESYEALNYELGLLQQKHAGMLRLGASTTIAQYVLPPLLAKFNEKFPQVSISLQNGNSTVIENALRERQIDLGFIESDAEPAGFKVTPFLKDELVLVAHVKNPLARRDEISLNELKVTPLVLREDGSGTLEVIQHALKSRGISFGDLNVQMQLGSTESIKRYLENSHAAGIVSVRAINRELLHGTFKVVDITGFSMPRYFSYLERLGKSPALVQTFIDFVNRFKKEL
ncbi:DNA-binding transcriptional regulator, LysR family [Fibrobacter sp. UWT3]|uniref:LysR substrate-binding domain-containing protein n=1 Tax=Fibrobacter sp. UWT3 TaxID=1896225 RepID=UPI000BDDE611|nr:LysR substrate-binding domain-containing protein [Fibrobacter sp. UWT3]SOE49771.1 DNA-binding transcriptional regulator, LysR family [Fibrobacter sp. UWT3]